MEKFYDFFKKKNELNKYTNVKSFSFAFIAEKPKSGPTIR